MRYNSLVMLLEDRPTPQIRKVPVVLAKDLVIRRKVLVVPRSRVSPVNSKQVSAGRAIVRKIATALAHPCTAIGTFFPVRPHVRFRQHFSVIIFLRTIAAAPVLNCSDQRISVTSFRCRGLWVEANSRRASPGPRN
jgi:hypothetical protein